MTPIEIASERDSRNVCILCESDSQPRSRGLCTKHYRRYTRAREALSEEKRSDYDQLLIANGMLLESNQGKRSDIADENEFELMARIAGASEEIAGELLRLARKKAGESTPKKRPDKKGNPPKKGA